MGQIAGISLLTFIKTKENRICSDFFKEKKQGLCCPKKSAAHSALCMSTGEEEEASGHFELINKYLNIYMMSE